MSARTVTRRFTLVTLAVALVAVPVLATPGRTAEAIPGAVPGPRQVALTFDDGPAAATGPILDILAAYGVPATFFVLGAAVDTPWGQEMVRRMHREGHSVQNHSYRHPWLTRVSDERIRSEIGATSRAVERAIGVPTTCFRPPYGATSPRVRANALGHTEIMWTADSNDYQRRGVASIIANSLRGADGRGMIVLLHDGGGNRQQTVAALPLIIEAYAARGYEFVNLCRDDAESGATENGAEPPPVVPVGARLGLEPVPPVRAFDSRLTGQRVLQGSSTAVVLPDGIPTDAVAVIAQLTAVDPDGPGWLGTHRCGTGPPGTSSLNVDPRVIARSGTAIAPVVDGRICVHSSTDAHLLVDVTAALVPGGGLGLRPEAPRRLLDSRLTGGPLASGTVSPVELGGRAGALVNVTATDTIDLGFITAWPCEQPRPNTSILNQTPGQSAIATATLLPVGGDGRLCFANDGATSVIVDLIAGLDPDPETGWQFQPVEPVRLLDTRTGTGGWSGRLVTSGRIDLATTMPPGVLALMTITAAESVGPGHLVVWDGTEPMPPTSALNHDRLDVANLVGVILDGEGRLTIQAEGGGSSHVLIDLYGWFAAD